MFDKFKDAYKKDDFLKVYSKVQTELEEQKLERKKQAKAEKLINPEK